MKRILLIRDGVRAGSPRAGRGCADPEFCARDRRDARQSEPRRLADVQPDLRCAAVQSAEPDHQAECRPARRPRGRTSCAHGHDRRHPDRVSRRAVRRRTGRGVSGRSTRPAAICSGNTSATRPRRREPKTLAIYDDIVFYTAPDGYLVALDATTGKVRWETKTERRHHLGADRRRRQSAHGPHLRRTAANCYIAAHDAKTGKEAWRFYTAAGNDDPGGETWGGSPEATRSASTWGLPGTYDPVRRLIYWGIANPMPNTRMARHGGNPDAIARSAPADLYSNSTVALNPDTGKLVWYYQHLPGDDWDEDYTHERTLVRTAVNPDPKLVKWINPDIPRGSAARRRRRWSERAAESSRSIAATASSSGRRRFPTMSPNFLISGIDGKTGKTSHQLGSGLQRAR